jgi:murein peptide amidase A
VTTAHRCIGRSLLGRPIEALSAGDGPTRLLVHGGIHGDEPGAVLAVERFATLLAALGVRVVVVPAVNPDGLAAGVKDNARGVDLNRNFPSRSWRPGQLFGPGAVTGARYLPGPAALSEPESAALAALIDVERPHRLVAVHQPLRCVNYDGPARALAERMAAACGWPVVADLGYPTPGSFGARYGTDDQREVITLELPRPASEADLAAALRALRAACV